MPETKSLFISSKLNSDIQMPQDISRDLVHELQGATEQIFIIFPR